ncbi:MAG: ABC transporter substrate-binding protein [Acidimicrobiales bacterium]
MTDTTIDVGTMADPGAAADPGLDQELFDTAKAFTTWCNNAGGINGRKIVSHLRDAKLFEVAARTVEACAQDFVEVGSGTAFDDAGTAVRVACGLPEIPAYDNSPKATEAPLKVQANPLPIQQQTTSMYRGTKQLFPANLKAGFAVGNLPGVIITKDRMKDAAVATGYTVAYDETYPITGFDNPQASAQRMKDAGVDVLQVVGSPPAAVQLEKAFATINWYPKAIVLNTNFYDNLLVQNGGDALKNTWVAEYFYPFEDPSPATTQYVSIMKTDDPGGKIAALGLNAWDSWLLFATAARDCGSNLTRACILDKAGSNTQWTAGGLKGPVNTDPVHRQMGQCYLFLKAQASGFSLDPSFLPPNQGKFNCDPANVVTLTTDYTPKG